MNGRERILSAFRGEMPDRVPVMLHNFMLAAHEAGLTMARFRSDSRAAAEAFLLSAERYGHDGIMMDVDTMLLAEACGVPVDLPEYAPARACGARIDDIRQAADLPPVDLLSKGRAAHWLETVRILVERSAGELLIRGNCDQCPYSVAALIRGIEPWMMDLLDPEIEPHIRVLLEYATCVTSQMLTLMAQTGAHMLSNGDSMSGPDVISPKLYRSFAKPYETRIAAHAHALGLPYVQHVCGKTDRIIEDMIETGADGLELDYKTDVHLAEMHMRGRAVFIGNIDPSGVLANGTPADVRSATRKLVKLFRENPRFVLNAGCAIPETTPPENLHAMIEASRQE